MRAAASRCTGQKIAGGVDRAEEGVKRVVQVDEPQQVMQRALADEERACDSEPSRRESRSTSRQ